MPFAEMVEVCNNFCSVVEWRLSKVTFSILEMNKEDVRLKLWKSEIFIF